MLLVGEISSVQIFISSEEEPKILSELIRSDIRSSPSELADHNQPDKVPRECLNVDKTVN